MNRESVEQDFQRAIKREQKTMRNFWIEVAKAMSVRVENAHVQNHFTFLENFKDLYRVETITASEFMFLVIVFGHRKCHRGRYNDHTYTEFLQAAYVKLKKQKALNGAERDFYDWFIHKKKPVQRESEAYKDEEQAA